MLGHSASCRGRRFGLRQPREFADIERGSHHHEHTVDQPLDTESCGQRTTIAVGQLISVADARPITICDNQPLSVADGDRQASLGDDRGLPAIILDEA